MPPLGQAGGSGGMAVGTFHEIEQAYLDLRWHLDPVAATQAGVKTYDDRYGRYSPPALVPHLAALKSLAGALEETTADQLEDEIDRTALLNEIRVVLHRFERERPQARSPAFWLNHLLGGLHFLLGRGDRSDEERARALIGRLEDVPRLLDDARAALAQPVRVFVETAQRINAGGLGLVRGIAAAIPDAPPGPGDALRVAVEQAAEAMTAFDRDLERWLDTASEEFALGEEEFNFRLHYEHALRDTAPELWRYGLHLQEEVMRAHCRHDLAATALHEGYPGHHLQLVHAQQQRSDTRKNVWTPVTVEGWALYCEDMMGEEGFYRSEEEQFFQRVHLLWRAARVLLDVGLHTRGMTFAQAVDQLVTHVNVERSNAEGEVRRYCAEPAYPLSYAVGRRELLKLRDDFRTAQGEAFTLRGFHDAILRYGGLPVALIRWGLGLSDT